MGVWSLRLRQRRCLAAGLHQLRLRAARWWLSPGPQPRLCLLSIRTLRR